MFDLETAIKNWRAELQRQKVGGPEILDELESHLREEIIAQRKSSCSESDAFAKAVVSIGQAQILRREFGKSRTTRQIIGVVLSILGWLAAGTLLFYSALGLYSKWNFWSWNPQRDFGSAILIVGQVISLTAIWALTKFRHDKPSRIVSLLICLWFVWLGLQIIPPEPTSGGWLGRAARSPFWYRSGTLVVLCIPFVLWVWSAWRKSTWTDRQTEKLVSA